MAVEGAQGLNRCQDDYNACLVIGGTARVEAPIPHCWGKRAGGPFGRADRLSIVVCVDDQGSLGLANLPLAQYDRRRIGYSGGCQQPRAEVQAAHLGRDGFGVAPDAFVIAGDIGDFQQLDELIENLLLVCGGECADVRCRGGGASAGRDQTDSPDYFFHLPLNNRRLLAATITRPDWTSRTHLKQAAGLQPTNERKQP